MSNNTKTVYQTAIDGTYIGTIILSDRNGDIDPVEKGKTGRIVFLIPRGCIEVKPPDIPEGKKLFWHNNTWILEDMPVEKPELEHPEPPTIEEIKKQYVDAVQVFMDKKAQERGYDNIFTAISYSNSTNETFRAEGQACLEWRDSVWVYCYTVFDDVMAENKKMPTIEELLEELPKLEW